MENGLVNVGWEGSSLQTFVDTSLQLLMYVVVIGLVIWLIFAFMAYLHRRAYNLTQAETVTGGSVPDFLDNSGRSENIRDKAIAFDERIAAEASQDDSSDKNKKLFGLVRGITSLAAILTFVVAIIGAVGRIQVYDTTLQNLSSMDHFLDVIQDFWIGSAVAGLIILVQLIRLVFSFRK